MKLKLLIMAAFSVLCVANRLEAQTGKLEFFADRNGTACTLTDVPGPVSLFVIQTGGQPSTGVGWFSAPKPACWNATWIADNWLPNAGKLGGSQTEIQVAFGVCRTIPVYVLEIIYISAGATAPCCNYPLKPGTSYTHYAACNFAEYPLVIGPANVTINPDASCACSGPLATEASTWGHVKSLYR